MNPDCSLFRADFVSLGRDLLKIDNEHLGIMFGVSKEFGRVESEDMVGDSFRRLCEKVADDQP